MSATPEEVTGQVDAAPQEASKIPVVTEYANLTNTGKGRPKGATNHTTREAKQLGMMMANQQVDEAIAWLRKVGEDQPARAFELYLDLLRLLIPQRSGAMSAEFVAGDGQSPFAMRFRGMFGTPPIDVPQ